uniref:RRM domain-containing protein n=1 Tax=Lactuca sativa TaxID=4236 RepID=A0A9R1WXP3_LACSA|nr:hypothetical protein LSAT_V11C800392360 [Lactuca sativa]
MKVSRYYAPIVNPSKESGQRWWRGSQRSPDGGGDPWPVPQTEEKIGRAYAGLVLSSFEEAEKAIVVMDGSEMLIQNVNIDWAFSEGPFRRRNNRRRSPHGNWSRSPRMRF